MSPGRVRSTTDAMEDGTIQGIHDGQVPREIDPETGLAIGPRLADAGPAGSPARVVLEGRYARLEPLDPARHGDDLHAAATPPDAAARFRYMPDLPPASPESFRTWLAGAAGSEDPLFFAVVDRATGRAEGWADVPAYHAGAPVYRDRQHLLGAADCGHPRRHRGDVPVRRIRAGDSRQPSLRVEVRHPERPVARAPRCGSGSRTRATSAAR